MSSVFEKKRLLDKKNSSYRQNSRIVEVKLDLG